MRGSLFVISAPSGAGKSTLIARLVREIDALAFSVSWTTRAPRGEEEDGVQYHFRDEAAFREKIAAGGFLEWAEVHVKLYGTGRDESEAVLASGRDLVLDIDVQGAEQVRASGMPAHTIFVLPPDAKTLEARLTGRGTEDDAALARRLANARAEILRWEEFDHLIVNDDLERASAELVAIFRAERTRRARLADTARRVAASFE